MSFGRHAAATANIAQPEQGRLLLRAPRQTEIGLVSAATKPVADGALRRFLTARFAALAAVLSLPSGDPELAHAQLGVLAEQIPMLFVILIANALALALTHARVAPWFLTVVIPAILCMMCYHRVRYWRRLDLSAVDGTWALAKLRTMVVTIVVFGVIFTTWSLSLYPYGDAYARCHVAFYMAITVISCILCLTHLRCGALLLTAVVLVPFTIFFLLTGNLVLIAMAANFVLVAAGLIVIMLRNYDGFVAHFLSLRETRRLSDDNLRLAYLDALTGLPNRRSFLAELDTVLAVSKKTGVGFAVAIIDLDRFKSVNDTYGHAAGDRRRTVDR